MWIDYDLFQGLHNDIDIGHQLELLFDTARLNSVLLGKGSWKIFGVRTLEFDYTSKNQQNGHDPSAETGNVLRPVDTERSDPVQ